MSLPSPPHSPQRSLPSQVAMRSLDLEECFGWNFDDRKLYGRVKDALLTGKQRIIVITGAGISVSSGIPDFRSAGGLYERLGLKFGEKSSDKNMSVKGKDFFDAAFFHAEKTRPLFYRFIAELKEMCDGAEPTPTHHFLKRLVEEKRVVRWYTQNIDGLEERMGLESSTTNNPTNPPVVGLHGTLSKLSCTLCKASVPYEQHEKLKEGQSPDCSTCKTRMEQRAERGQRRVKGGFLRPDIVLYNEPHPQGDRIGEFLASDLSKRPTLLLVIGTSLKVVGLKRMIKDIAKSVHATSPDNLVVYMNKMPVMARSEWKGVFDVELVGECDKWVSHLQSDEPAKTTTVELAKENVPEPSVNLIEPSVNLTPVKPAAKAKKIDQFFKHVKSSSASTTKPKDKLANPANINQPNHVPVMVSATTRSRRRAL